MPSLFVGPWDIPRWLQVKIAYKWREVQHQNRSPTSRIGRDGHQKQTGRKGEVVKTVALKHPVLHSNQSKKIELPAANSVDSDARPEPQDPCSSQRTGTTPHHMVGHAKNVPGLGHTFSLGLEVTVLGWWWHKVFCQHRWPKPDSTRATETLWFESSNLLVFDYERIAGLGLTSWRYQ